MKINFFAEFPENGELKKAELIDYPSKIVIAARDLERFHEYQSKLREVNPELEAAYWPVLEKSYWASPFSPISELERISKEAEATEAEVFLDIEAPILSKKLFITGLHGFKKKKTLIESVLEKEHVKGIESARDLLYHKISQVLGLSYPTEKVFMYYTSQAPDFILGSLKRRLMKQQGDFSIGLGCLDTGMLGNEDIISPENLRRDLKFAEELGLSEVYIFRLNAVERDDFREILDDFVDN